MDNIIIDTKELFEGSDLAIESMVKSLKEMCPDLKLLDFSVHANFETNTASHLRITMDYGEGGYQNVNIGMKSFNTKLCKSLEEDGDEKCQ